MDDFEVDRVIGLANNAGHTKRAPFYTCYLYAATYSIHTKSKYSKAPFVVWDGILLRDSRQLQVQVTAFDMSSPFTRAMDDWIIANSDQYIRRMGIDARAGLLEAFMEAFPEATPCHNEIVFRNRIDYLAVTLGRRQLADPAMIALNAAQRENAQLRRELAHVRAELHERNRAFRELRDGLDFVMHQFQAAWGGILGGQEEAQQEAEEEEEEG